MEAADRFAEPDLRRGPAFPLVLFILDDLELQSRGMIEPDKRLSEAFSGGFLFDVMALQVILPERESAFGNGKRGGIDLAGAAPPLEAAVRKRGHDGSRFDLRVRVIQVIDRNLAIHEHGLLGHAQAKRLRKEIDIVLGASGASGDVVISGEWVIHERSPKNSTLAQTGSAASAGGRGGPDLPWREATQRKIACNSGAGSNYIRRPRVLSTRVKCGLLRQWAARRRDRARTQMHASAGLQVDEPGARDALQLFAVLQGVFQVAAGDAGVLAGERLGAHALVIGDRLDNRAMLVGGNQEQFLQLGRYILPFQESAGRRKRQRAGLFDGAAQHAAAREIEQSAMKAGVQFDIEVEAVDGEFAPPDQRQNFAAGLLQRFQIPGVAQSFGGEAGSLALEQAAQFNRVEDVVGGESLDHEAAGGPDLQKALVRQPFQGQVQRDAGDLQFGGQGHFANPLAGTEAPLHQHFAERQSGARGLRGRSGFFARRHALNVRFLAHASPSLAPYFIAKRRVFVNLCMHPSAG